MRTDDHGHWPGDHQSNEPEATFEKGHEHYSNVTIDGKPPTDQTAEAMKLFSTGELGSDLVDLFRTPPVAEFKLSGEERVNKTAALVYKFHIAAEKKTFWSLWDSRGGTSYPEYQGELWVERDSGRLLRLKLQPIHLPMNFDVISAVVTNEYNYIVIADAGRFLLPTTSITAACFHTPVGGDWFCRKNTLLFHDCRKFGTDRASFLIRHSVSHRLASPRSTELPFPGERLNSREPITARAAGSCP